MWAWKVNFILALVPSPSWISWPFPFFSSSTCADRFCVSSVSLSVYHPVSCSYCRGNGMTGFRYRCLRCRGYQLCQNCFWRGNASGSHSNKHQMKEHSSWVSHCVSLHSLHQGALHWCVHVCTCPRTFIFVRIVMNFRSLQCSVRVKT